MNDLDQLLSQAEPIADAGFSERVLGRLPRRRRLLALLDAWLPPVAVVCVAPMLPLGAAVALSVGIAVYAFADA